MATGIGRSSGTFAFCSIIAMLMGSTAVAHADGIPTRGNCCADLEERVAELEATTARKGNRRVSLTVSGQVTTALMAWNDGDDDDIYVVDNTVAGGSLFQFTGSAKISPKLTAGFQLAVGLDKGARMNHVTQADDDGGQPNDTTIVVTHANWYLDHAHLGRVTVGRTNTATAGITTIDLGGTGVIANSSIGYTGGSFFSGVGGSAYNDLLGGGTVSASGLARANAIMYTSPTFGGFSASIAAGEDELWDVALRYAGEHAGFRIAGAVGYAYNHGGRDDIENAGSGTVGFDFGPVNVVTGATGVGEPSQWKAGLAVLHVGTGLYAQGAYVRQDYDTTSIGSFVGLPGTLYGVDRSDAQLYYLQAGISKNWTGLGKTALYGEYAKVEDGATGLLGSAFFGPGFVGLNTAFHSSDSNAEVWGLGVVQHIDAAAMELFLAYRHYSAEVTFTTPFFPVTGTADANDLDVVIGGARIKF